MERTTWHATMQCPCGAGAPARVQTASGLWRRGVFEGLPGGPQENSSLGTALDPKLEAGRPRALPALESRGFCARIGDG